MNWRHTHTGVFCFLHCSKHCSKYWSWIMVTYTLDKNCVTELHSQPFGIFLIYIWLLTKICTSSVILQVMLFWCSELFLCNYFPVLFHVYKGLLNLALLKLLLYSFRTHLDILCISSWFSYVVYIKDPTFLLHISVWFSQHYWIVFSSLFQKHF